MAAYAHTSALVYCVVLPGRYMVSVESDDIVCMHVPTMPWVTGAKLDSSHILWDIGITMHRTSSVVPEFYQGCSSQY